MSPVRHDRGGCTLAPLCPGAHAAGRTCHPPFGCRCPSLGRCARPAAGPPWNQAMRTPGHGEQGRGMTPCLGGTVEFQLLGPLEVTHTGSPVPLGGPRQRALLTALLLRANRLATVPYLTESVWESPPVAPESNLRTHVAGLRRRLPEAGARLLTKQGGYLLQVLPGECDLTIFDQLTSDLSDTAGQELLDRLDRALALWRGQPLEGLAMGPQLAIEVTRLTERRIDIALRYARAAVALGRHHDVVSRLHGLVEQYPLHEELWAHLIGALQRCGRDAEALVAYEQARAH